MMCVILNSFLLLLLYTIPGAFAYVVGPWIVFGFALAHLIDAIYLYKIFEKYMPEEKEPDETEEADQSTAGTPGRS